MPSTGKYPTHGVLATQLDGVAEGLGDLPMTSDYVRDAAAAVRDLGDRLDAALKVASFSPDELLVAFRQADALATDEIASLRAQLAAAQATVEAFRPFVERVAVHNWSELSYPRNRDAARKALEDEAKGR